MNFLTIYITDNITLVAAIISLISALAIGAIFAAFYGITNKEAVYDRSFIATLVIMPIIVSMIVMLISNDVVKAVSLGGMFAILRFRSRIKNTKDAALLFTVIGLGYACGLQYYKYVILITLFVLIVYIILAVFKIDSRKKDMYRLKILVPESMDYTNIFEQVFQTYLKQYTLKSVKVSDFGTLIELNYIIQMNNPQEQKKFLDLLRQKNGNLNIVIADDYDKLVEA